MCRAPEAVGQPMQVGVDGDPLRESRVLGRDSERGLPVVGCVNADER